MTDDLDGTFSAVVSGLTTGTGYEFKVQEDGWVNSWPGSNAKTVADANGDLTIHFTPGAVADGWSPAENRVGYDDPEQFGWQIIGAFDGWSGQTMSDLGGGLYSIDYMIAAANTYDWKFRDDVGNWDYSIGDDFGNAAANNSITTADPNTIVRFELDLPNGRWNTTVIPEPATITLALLGGIALLWRRRR